MGTQQVPLMTPVKGVVRAVGRESQPPDTCWDARNALPYDRYGRKRLAQRGGLLRQFPDSLNGNFVQGMIEAPNIIYPPNSFDVPFGDVDELLVGFPDPPTFGPGTVGPFPYAGPVFSATLEWSATLTITGTIEVDPADPVNWAANSGGGLARYCFAVGDGPNDNLICELGFAGNPSMGVYPPGQINPIVNIRYGSPTAPTSITSLSFTPSAANSPSSSTTTTVTITIRSDHTWSVVSPDAPPYNASIPGGVSKTNFPEPFVQQVSVDANPGGADVNNVAYTLTVAG